MSFTSCARIFVSSIYAAATFFLGACAEKVDVDVATPEFSEDDATVRPVLVASADDDTINLLWTFPLTAESFEIRSAPKKTGPWDTIATPDGTELEHADQNLLPFTTYFYKMRARVGTRWSGWSVVTSATTGEMGVRPPTHVLAIASSCTRIDLSWRTYGGPAVSFEVYRDGAMIRSVSGETRTMSDTVGASSAHTYTLTAIDDDGDRSTMSKEAFISTTPCNGPTLCRSIASRVTTRSFTPAADPLGPGMGIRAVATSDGGTAFAWEVRETAANVAAQRNVHITRLNASGSPVGTEISVVGTDALGLVAHNDGYAVLVGRQYPGADNPTEAVLVRVDLSGNVLWETSIVGAGVRIPSTPGDKWYSYFGDGALAWSGSYYTALVPIQKDTGEVAKHQHDYIKFIDASGDVINWTSPNGITYASASTATSHSVNQRLVSDGTTTAAIVMSDAYPIPGVGGVPFVSPLQGMRTQVSFDSHGWGTAFLGQVAPLSSGYWISFSTRAWFETSAGNARLTDENGRSQNGADDDIATGCYLGGGRVAAGCETSTQKDIALVRTDSFLKSVAPNGVAFPVATSGYQSMSSTYQPMAAARIWITSTPNIDENSPHVLKFDGNMLAAYRVGTTSYAVPVGLDGSVGTAEALPAPMDDNDWVSYANGEVGWIAPSGSSFTVARISRCP